MPCAQRFTIYLSKFHGQSWTFDHKTPKTGWIFDHNIAIIGWKINLEIPFSFDQIPRQLGRKFKFSLVPGEFRKRELQPCFNLLAKVGVVHPVYHTSAQGLPLGAEADLDKFKTIFLDVGLAQSLLGLNLKE